MRVKRVGTATSLTLAPSTLTKLIGDEFAALFKKEQGQDISDLKKRAIEYNRELLEGGSDLRIPVAALAVGQPLLEAIKKTTNLTDDELKKTYDTFEFTTKDALRGYQPDVLNLTKVRPLNHFFGLHTFYPTFASGEGAAPFRTLADYENNLKRHREYVTYLDRAIARFRQGQAAGVVETKLTTRNMIEQIESQLEQGVETSTFYGPVKKFPAEIGAADRARLKAEYRTVIAGELYPAMRRLRDYLKAEYLPAAREGAGIMYMKGGNQLYRELVRSTTTLPLEPEEVHQLGLREVAR